jgi:large subunit ribosomal protein L32
MPNPKRRHSKTRRDKRRTHDGTTPVAFTSCPNCGNTVKLHHVCTECGHYKGRQIIAAKDAQ